MKSILFQIQSIELNQAKIKHWIGKDLYDKDIEEINKQEKKIVHYPGSLNNSIFTDYLNFYLYSDGQLVSMLKKTILWY